jgi:hypothetical protein
VGCWCVRDHDYVCSGQFDQNLIGLSLRVHPFDIPKQRANKHDLTEPDLRRKNYPITSGYRVDAEGKPGGGGLMIFRAEHHAAAEELVLQDPLIANDCVDWQVCVGLGGRQSLLIYTLLQLMTHACD